MPKVKIPRGAIAKLTAADPALGRAMNTVGPLRMEYGTHDNALAALARSIVFQQLSGKAAGTIWGRFCDLFRGSKFPQPRTILKRDDETLRGCGLSRQKVLAVRDLCERAARGELPLDDAASFSDEDLIEQLVRVRGIGVWSAQMFLMFHLGRLDVWPVDDLGVKKGVQLIQGWKELPDKKAMVKIGERYGPYRSIAAWYSWRILDVETA